MPSQAELLSLLLLPLVAFLIGALVITLLEKQVAKAQHPIRQDG
ncbi:hypothetical protein P2G88_18840 [Aliiglaciecola sp. CAU 1673]|nr:hypothetical protein [Aliiglaciecola sp. CAU 1673]MDF2180319.1 hypothetical protein [Aliiglaciecola sp. CAU 1673]